MSDLELFLICLRCMDTYLWLDEGKLRYRAPPGRLAPELAQRIRDNRAELTALLQTDTFAPPSDPDATIPFDGSMNCVQTHMLGYYSFLDRPEFLHPSSVWSWIGEMNVDLLRESFLILASRHSALRSRFRVDPAHQYRMVESDTLDLRIDVRDIRSVAPSERESAARKITEEVVRGKFDVRTPPLFRICVIRMSSEHHIVVFVFHHVIMDGFSSSIITDEFGVIYTALLSGITPPLPPPGIGFLALVSQQNAWLASPEAAMQTAHWRTVFEGVRRPFWLPHDEIDATKPCSADPGPVSDRLSRPSVAALKQTCRLENAQLHAAMMAAFAIAIGKWRKESDVCMWVINHGRHMPAHAGQVGCFTDSWALRANFDMDCAFPEALRSVAAAAFDAAANTMLPSQQVAQIIGSMTSIDRATIFNYLGAGLFDAPRDVPSAPSDARAPYRISRLDWLSPQGYLETVGGTQLLITVREDVDGIDWAIQYDPTVFKRSSIVRLSDKVREEATARTQVASFA